MHICLSYVNPLFDSLGTQVCGDGDKQAEDGNNGTDVGDSIQCFYYCWW